MKDDATILLAEDYGDDVALLRRAFNRAGVERVVVVANGDQAIEYLLGGGPYADRARYPFPSLLLLDIKMPRRSGLEVLQWVRQREPIKGLPIVVLTSSQSMRDVNDAHQFGANSYLVKPTDFRELVKVIKVFADYWLGTTRLPTFA
jgi:CheY-like chemotaxis protein